MKSINFSGNQGIISVKTITTDPNYDTIGVTTITNT